jgi:hypothetical protein
MRFQEVSHMRRQSAVRAIEDDSDLPLDQKPQLGDFVLQDGAGCH